MRYSPETRWRQSRLLWLVLAAVLLAAVVLCLGIAYQVGASQSQARIDSLLNDLDAHSRLVSDLSRRAATAEQTIARLRGEGAKEMPPDVPASPHPGSPPAEGEGSPADAPLNAPLNAMTSGPARLAMTPGEMQQLVAAIHQRSESGVPVATLIQAIDATQPPPACANVMEETRSFLARTPVTRDPSTARLLDNRIRVAGTGISVRAANGLPEAWFDPARPVTLDIDAAGTPVKLNGVLPLQTDLVVDGKSFQLAAAVDTKRGFIAVTLKGCP